ncbi:MAG: hypothetical protein F6K50_42310 [Moorea sp. SIO3I7]|nr:MULTISPECIES: hypothetical protein [unclassified Moorena]NEO01788.1 hypothetical protein [Moorena sp. SIO3I7]NEO25198.1 hypothetical protein [Moorena sp. SIO4A5]NEO65016.1 hypothetical protein [Moorena sp. SIO4G2]NEP27238.1 hypothetical protein [Moorena sp. SIO3I6]
MGRWGDREIGIIVGWAVASNGISQSREYIISHCPPARAFFCSLSVNHASDASHAIAFYF